MAQRQANILALLEKHWKLEGRLSPQEHTRKVIESRKAAESDSVFELIRPKIGVNAKAQQTSEGFLVFKDSVARAQWGGGEHHYANLHQKLKDDGSLLLSEKGDYLIFQRDVLFNSPSAASAIIFGRSDSGPNSWQLLGTDINYRTWAKQGTSNIAEDE